MDVIDAQATQQMPTLPLPPTEISHVTEELYKKNFELAEKNKTLLILRKIDDIILSSLTDVQAIAQKVTNVLAENEIFPVARIYLVENENKVIRQLTISQTEPVENAEKTLGITFQKLLVPLTDEKNLLVQAVHEEKRKATHSLFDVLTPMFSEEQARKIQDIFGIRSTLVLPLIARGQVIGILTVNMSEDYEKLSAYDEDLLTRLVDLIGIALDKALLYKEVEEANEKLRALDKLKDEFISITSHELRTPMNTAKSYLWMVLNKANSLPEEKKKVYLERAYLSSKRLIFLVNDMLNISRIESGRILLMPGIIPYEHLVREAENEFVEKAKEKHITFTVNAGKLSDVYGDKEKIREILLNLFSNAIKYTQESGTITVTISQKDAKWIETAVKDNGRGFKIEDAGKLFTKFGRLHNSLTDVAEQDGTGLGLYIAKQFTELSGGKIWADSKGEGKGSTFTFTIPVYNGQKIIASQESAPNLQTTSLSS